MVANFQTDLEAMVRKHCADILLEHGFNREESLTLVTIVCMLIEAKVNGNAPNVTSVAAIKG